MRLEMNNKENYPNISNRLIECLERDFKDILPRTYKTEFELGILIGQQQVIDKLKIEKQYNEESILNNKEDL